MATLIFFNLIFTLVSLISNLTSFIVFKLISIVLVSVIHTFKTSGQAVQGVLELLGGVIKWVFDYVWEFALDSVWNLVEYVLELAWGAAWDSVGGAGSAIGGLVEKARESISGMMESDPEIMDEFWGMVGSVGGGVWSNCVDAVKHVFENV